MSEINLESIINNFLCNNCIGVFKPENCNRKCRINIIKKQLQQLKQKNEELKHKLSVCTHDRLSNDTEKINILIEENKELKKEVERNLKQQEIKDNYLHQIILKNEKLKEHKNKYYLQTLEDEATISRLVEKLGKIKELCKECQTHDYNDLCIVCKYCDRCKRQDAEYPSYDVVQPILQIIEGE